MFGKLTFATVCLLVYSFVVYLFVSGKTAAEVLKNLKKKNGMNPFYTQVASGMNGMKLVNDFIKTRFLVFINRYLIKIDSEGRNSVSVLFEEVKDTDTAIKLTTGFVLDVLAYMSDELKQIFYLYYKREENKPKKQSKDKKEKREEKSSEETTESNDTTLAAYIGEWFNLALREMNIQYRFNNFTDNSIDGEINRNDDLFIKIENELYTKYNILSQENLKEVK